MTGRLRCRVLRRIGNGFDVFEIIPGQPAIRRFRDIRRIELQLVQIVEQGRGVDSVPLSRGCQRNFATPLQP